MSSTNSRQKKSEKLVNRPKTAPTAVKPPPTAKTAVKPPPTPKPRIVSQPTNRKPLLEQPVRPPRTPQTPKKNSKWPVIQLPPIKQSQWRVLRAQPNVMILATTRTGSAIERRYYRHSATMSVAAIAYSYVYPTSQWNAGDIDKIMDIGKYLQRTSCMRKPTDEPIQPRDVMSSFYVDFIKITTLVGAVQRSGSFRQHCDHTDFLAHFEQILANCEGCILSCSGRHYAIWSSAAEAIFLYHPCEASDRTSYAKVNETSCIRIPKDGWVSTMTRLLKINGCYEIVSVKIMQLQEVSKYPGDPVTAMSLQKQWSEQSVTQAPELSTLVEEDDRLSENGDEDELSIEQKVPTSFEVSPYLDDFEQAFVPVANGRDILRAMNYVEHNFKIACINVAAIVMLRVARSITWTSDTVEEILTLGNRIYDNNHKHGEGQEVMPADIVEKIILGRNGYGIEAEQAVFGALSSTSPTVVDLQTGLTNFFATKTAGILQGPQTVAVWHDLHHFYMFDAKERDRYGRKWVASLVNADFCNGDMESLGRACVTRFTNLEDLVELYTETVQLKRRHDEFRITRIEVHDYKERSENWNEWKGIAINRWILRGRFSQGNQRFAEEHRNCQATCIAAVALVFSGLVAMNEWSVDVVDEILTMGDEYYRQCVEALMKDDKLVEKELCVAEICKYFTCREQNIELIVDDCLVNGSLLADGSNEFIDLKTAFDVFFTNNNCGILTACGQSLAFWRVAGAFYVFDSHARNSEGRNPMTCRQNLQTGILGTSCALRFLCLSELTKAVTDNFQLKDAPEFNLSRVDYVVVEADGTPPLRRYTTFGERAAMLRSMAAVHEGQRQLYDLRSDRQTLCNCLVALSMVQLNHSVNWTRNDLFDILRMGDQMFTRISQAVPQPIDDDFAVEWEHLLTSDGINIGINRFSVSVENVEGQFERKPVDASEDVVKTISITDSKRSKLDFQDSGKARAGGSMAHRTGSMLERLSVNVSGHGGTIGSAQSVTSSQRSVKSVVPPPPVLMDLLKKWDEEESSKAIVQSILFKIAIWKQNKLYFAFDPKACDENGKLTQKRVKRAEKAIRKRRLAEAGRKVGSRSNGSRSADIIEDVEEKDTSTEKMVPVEQVIPVVEPSFIEEPSEDESEDTFCYSAWFTTLEDLHKHLLSLVPGQEHRFEAVTLVNVTLTPISSKTPARVLSSSNYQLISENPTKTFILRASMSQNDQIFPKTPNRNRQDITNCVTAIALATFCPAEDWTATILDVVLKYGDRLYTKSLHARALINSLEKLSVHQVVSPFILANVRIDLTVDRFGTGDLTAEPGSLCIRCVHDVLVDFFNNDGSDFGILVARQYSVAVWRMNETYYMFDAHDIGPDARKCVNGVACLCRFESLEPLSQVFLANLDGPSGSNAFELYRIKITKTKLPNEVGICKDPADSSKNYRMVDSKETSAYRGSKEMKILHGNINETSESLKWNTIPPTACHVVVALAMSRDVKANFWTPRTIDQILILGNEVYAKTLQHMKIEFNPTHDRLHVRRVRKNFPMSGHLVHLELELPTKGIIKCRSGTEISLKIGIYRLFESSDCGTIETPTLIVAVWQECGYFYIFYPNAIGTDGLIGDNGTACVIRFTNKAHLYNSLMHNIPKDREGDTFEIRGCDFTLSPLLGRPLRVDEESKVDVVEKSNASSTASIKQPIPKKVKRRTTCYKSMSGNREILCGTTLCRKSEMVLMQKQSGAKTIVAIAMSFIEDINRWSSRTVDLIVTSGVRLYNESVILHKSNEITLCQLPRKLFIGNISLEMQILSPTLCESEMCDESLKSFFEEHTMAYMVRNGNVCVAVIRVLNQFFFFDSTPCFKKSAASEGALNDLTAARVTRFKNFQQLLEHLRSCKLLPTDSGFVDAVLMGPIKCWRKN